MPSSSCLALPILLYFLWTLIAQPLTPQLNVALSFCLALAALPLLQLVPLPPWLWTRLPNGDASAFEATGQAVPWMPLSVSPQATLLVLLSLIPPLAVFLGAVQLSYRERRWLSLVLIGVGIVSVFLGLVQVAQGQGIKASQGPAGRGRSARSSGTLGLMRLVFAWSRKLHEGGLDDPAGYGPQIATPAQASYLAADLGNLMDFIESEEVDLAALENLAPEEYAEHWAKTVDFLKIVTEHWPAYLRDNGLVSPTARRNRLMEFEAARLVTNPPAGPVIAAGSTGTVPATARLLKVIASLPNGAVVLPGLDLSLDEESWASLAKHPEHPQTGMTELLNKLGATRDDVRYVQGSQPNVERRARLKFVSEVLRPAGDTDRWQTFLKTEDASLPTALAGLQTLETPTAHDEAEAIALILRSTIETPGKTAALITPDRTLVQAGGGAAQRRVHWDAECPRRDKQQHHFAVRRRLPTMPHRMS